MDVRMQRQWMRLQQWMRMRAATHCLARPSGPPRGLVSRTFSSEGGSTYYDSQSGRWMTYPGTQGVRVHDISAVYWSAHSSMAQRYRRLVEGFAAGASSVQLWDGRESGELSWSSA
jgi:hypothetical protein